MYPKSKNGALLALLAAGGLYAWRNRDKIQSWINNQTSQYSNRDTTYPSTGDTRRYDSDFNRTESQTPLSERQYGTEL